MPPDLSALPAPPLAPIRTGIAGATGYAGQELLRRLARHPGATIAVATASQTAPEPRRLPALARIWDGEIRPLDAGALAHEADIVFLALPEAASARLARVLLDAGVRVIDLSGAFRLRDAAVRARWYPATGDLPDGVVYGLTEFARVEIARARLVANPGCYPIAALLALQPLAPLLAPDGDVVIDAKSGLSGAGKTPSARTHFSENHGSVAAYAPLAHRHEPEIAEALGREIAFTPHLVPLDRGILATIHARVQPGTTDADVAARYTEAYAGAPFVRVRGADLPEIRHVAWTNFCDIGWALDERRGRLVIVAAIDNLLKGAAGSAIQNFNVMAGFDETLGLL